MVRCWLWIRKFYSGGFAGKLNPYGSFPELLTFLDEKTA
jgi:hypothetical protein